MITKREVYICTVSTFHLNFVYISRILKAGNEVTDFSETYGNDGGGNNRIMSARWSVRGGGK